MIWNHEWIDPELRIMLTSAGKVYLPLQECVVCGSQRNALTRQITLRRRGSICNRMPSPAFQDDSAAYKRLDFAMKALEADGEVVARDWGANREKSVDPELRLAYKDD